eukprot:CAMPEP_0175045848 /NCGR_PEP_ID=MMETSP0052_2-20121109/4683_1 /TAXON_ID=51329 ORGANISM="Polytomella parva, Strain SAG 63-3" /NCGR_SAMPLE_ID=MMETSP0052_2 /ASSEMBLY_ACC=CAM_ASM_000194 /LENGTH=389 /DNA_ID=CAMNT_0016309489 /DNA_START=156 /DNA_END=1325 /DNA_ORIENTATION=-
MQCDQALATQEAYQMASNDVIATIPRYAAPNLASSLPFYNNSEQDFINRAFTVGNYDDIRQLPATLKEQQVQLAREARMKAAKDFLRPWQPGEQTKKLFTSFEYIPSRFSLADEIASNERVTSEAIRLTIGKGREFFPASNKKVSKFNDYDIERDGNFPYLGSAFENVDELKAAEKALKDAHLLAPEIPFRNAVGQKLPDAPSRQDSWSTMLSLKKLILMDWPDADLNLFENEHDCWVLRFEESSIDGAAGLVAYMNVMLRCNELVVAYRLDKVLEFWNHRPGDGGIYFVLRPPWVRPDNLKTFFALHPEELDWRTGYNAVAMANATAAAEAAVAVAESAGNARSNSGGTGGSGMLGMTGSDLEDPASGWNRSSIASGGATDNGVLRMR